MEPIVLYALIAVVSYLLGSISTGILVAKQKPEVDLRKQGSKNTGATNVLRVMGKKSAAITFIGDFLKAIIACLIGLWLMGTNGGMVAGLCVIIGHNWPAFFGWKGGKGVACSVAVMLVLFPIPALISIGCCILIIWITKMISVGSLSMLTIFAGIVIGTNWGNVFPCVWALIILILCYTRHIANIKRILSGTENKLRRKKQS